MRIDILTVVPELLVSPLNESILKRAQKAGLVEIVVHNIRVVNFLAAQNPQSIGLELYDDAFEYPLWARLSEKVKKMPKIFHLLSENDREKLNPQFIVVLGKGEGDAPLALPCVLGKRGNSYIKIFPPDRDRE